MKSRDYEIVLCFSLHKNINYDIYELKIIDET